MLKQIRQNFEEAQKLGQQFIDESQNLEKIFLFSKMMAKAILQKNKLISCGNGGSMSDSMHFAEELTARFKSDRISLPALAISDPAYLSCVSNDYGYQYVFSRFVEGLGQEGDILLGISTSGNSQNVVEAVKSAKKKKIISIGLLGKDGGELQEICDHYLIVPHSKTERIQEIHIQIIHNFIENIELILQQKNYF